MKPRGFLLTFLLVTLIFFAGCVNTGEFIPPPVTDTEKAQEKTEESSLYELAKNYFVFRQAEFDRALSKNKVIFLYFYDKFCGVCKGERPEVLAAFNELDHDNLIGFEVDYEKEEDMKERFQVLHCHAKVILKNGGMVWKTSEAFPRDELIEKIERFLE